MSKYENTALIDREAEELKQVAEQLHYEGELLTMLQNPKTNLLSNEERVSLNKALARELEKIEKNTKISDSDKKESKEKMKIPQLETENHKIDQGKFKKEKLAEGWKEEERPAYINGTETKIKVLKKELAKGAFVRVYQDDGKIPSHLVGEQLFNWKAVLSLGLKDRLPSYKQMETMRGGKENHGKFLENNFQKDGKNMFPGYWLPDNEKFTNIGTRTNCWLSDGDHVGLGKDHMNHDTNDPGFGFSLRLLKN